VQFENACPQFGVSPPPTNWGPKNHLLSRLRNLRATLTCYIFGTKHDINNWSTVKCGDNYKGSQRHLKTTWTLVHKRLQTGPPFLSTFVNFAFYVIASVRRRRSANRTQPHFAKRRMVTRANKLL